jgi:hypothetical protein
LLLSGKSHIRKAGFKKRVLGRHQYDKDTEFSLKEKALRELGGSITSRSLFFIEDPRSGK